MKQESNEHNNQVATRLNKVFIGAFALCVVGGSAILGHESLLAKSNQASLPKKSNIKLAALTTRQISLDV